MKLQGKIADAGLKAVSEEHYITDHHKVPRLLVVVADRHHVRIFTKPNGNLELVGEGTPSKLGRRNGTPDDSLGRIGSSASSAIHHKLEPRSTPDEKESLAFAHEISDWLDVAVRENSFDKLVLVAAPHTLGDLRKALSKAVQEKTVAEINKDFTKMNERDLLKELEKVVPL